MYRRLIKISIIGVFVLVMSGFCIWRYSLAYEPFPTHKSLTEKSAQLYKNFYQTDLSDDNIYQIIQGSILEDTSPRWINHFYDPTTGQGWNGKRMGILPDEVVRQLSLIGLSSVRAVSALKWAHDQQLQGRYLFYQGNRTFEKAVYDYVKGNRQEAYRSLGHIFHLLQDLSVPAHTRQDTHYDAVGDPGEPYEKWLQANTFLGHLNNLDPRQENFSCQSIDDCFIQVAKYSNENFFSEDTIINSGYNSPRIERIEDFGGYAYGYDVYDNVLYKVIFRAGTREIEKITIDDSEINSKYWQRLSKKSVLAGIEILRIFHETVAKAQQDSSLLEPSPRSSAAFFLKNLTGIGAYLAPQVQSPIISFHGAIDYITNIVKEYWKKIMPDKEAPDTYVSSLLFFDGQTVNFKGAIFEFYASETGAVFECQLDKSNFAPCESPKSYEGLSAGVHTFKVRAKDAAGNIDPTPATVTWTIQIALPEISLSLMDYKLTSINFVVAWNSNAAEIVYELEYKIGENGMWQDWASGAAASQKSFRATYDDTIYYFRGRTSDTIGNQSAWQEISAEISLNPVVINEIAWMGTIVSPRDEWIELYNKTGQDINLGQWVLNATDGNPSIALTGVIPAHGFFLLERTDDQTVPDVTADLIYPGAGVSQNMLANGGEELELKNAGGNIIDYIPYQSNWFAGNNANFRTMERINPYLAGTSAENWVTYSEAGAINGTPKAQNSQYDSNFSASTIISDTTIISRDTIWTLKGSPYLLESNYNQSPTLSAITTLIIEPGVIIKPQNKYYPGLIVKGTLLAQGVANQQIKFVSKENSPQAGDWGAIIFETGSDNSILDNVIFEYGGYKSDAQTCYMRNGSCQPINGMVMIYDSSPQIKNSLFQYSQYGGIWLNNSDANITNCSFSNNLRGATIRGANSQPIISGSAFQNQNNSGIGIVISDGASPSISSNNISGYSQAVYLESAYPIFSQNTVSNNSHNGIYVSHQSLFSQNATWQNNLTYLLMSNSGQYPTIATGTVLTIEPGVVIKPLNKNYTALKIEGRLTAEGTGSQKIVFTAFQDDSFGGDSNNDSNATVPGNSGEWRNIVFSAGSSASLSHINFKYGGFIPRYGGWMDDRYDSAATLEIEPGADVVQGDGVLIE